MGLPHNLNSGSAASQEDRELGDISNDCLLEPCRGHVESEQEKASGEESTTRDAFSTFTKHAYPFSESTSFSTSNEDVCNFTLVGKEYKYSMFDDEDHSEMYEKYRPKYPQVL